MAGSCRLDQRRPDDPGVDGVGAAVVAGAGVIAALLASSCGTAPFARLVGRDAWQAPTTPQMLTRC